LIFYDQGKRMVYTMQVQGATVLVTGGNRGLGKSLVQAFLDAGAKKVYVGSRTPIESYDPRLQPIKLDITNADDVANAVAGCQDVDILVNNAGIGTSTSFLATGYPDEARNTIETNYLGTLAMVRAFAPILKQNGGGTIANVLSVVSWFVSPTLMPYSASKFAELALTEGVRIELRGQGTRVIAVHAGYIDTDLAAQINDVKANPDDVAASILEGIRNDQEEVLADERSYQIKSVLASNRQAFYQNLLQSRA
jgi:NAD(P)-dependent dehydrogenase (short-subunit alcohol dehydrogenase family)